MKLRHKEELSNAIKENLVEEEKSPLDIRELGSINLRKIRKEIERVY